MTTTKSYSEKTRFFSIYRTALTGQIPFAIITAIIFATLIPLVFFVSYESHSAVGISNPAAIGDYYVRAGYFRSGIYLAEAHAGFALVVLMLLALVLALIQNAYMHSKKMTDLYHSLPIRRPQLLGANMLASMTTILAPFLAVYLITILAQVIFLGMPQTAQYIDHLFPRYFSYIAVDLLCAVVSVAAVYLFTTLISVNVGTVFDTFALTGVLGLLPMGVFLVWMAMWSSMTYGATSFFGPIALLCPFAFMFMRFSYMGTHYSYNYLSTISFQEYILGVWKTVGVLAVWAVVCVGLYFAAIACYKRRKSEIADQAQPTGVLQTAAKCFGAFCGAAVFLAIFYNASNLFVWLLAMLAGAILVGIIAELILSRGVRAVRKNIKWLLGAGVLCFVMLLSVHFDLAGYTTRIPSAEDVASVSMSYRGRFDSLSDNEFIRAYGREQYYGYYGGCELSSPEAIAVVTEAHHLAVQDQPPLDYLENSWDYWELEEQYPYQWLRLEYRMKNGKTVTRQYYRVTSSAVKKLAELEDKDEFITGNHMLFYLKGGELGVSDASRTDLQAEVRAITLYDSIAGAGTPHRIPDEELGRLLDAARQDMLEQSLEDIYATKAAGYIEFEYRYRGPYDDVGETSIGTCTVVVSKGFTRTLSVLAELDLLGDFALDDEIDSVVFSRTSEYYGSYSVRTLTPGNRPSAAYDYNYAYEDYVTSTDSALIDRLLNAGYAQMFTGRSDESKNSVIASYFSGTRYVGAQIIREEDMPQELLEQIRDRKSEDDFDETVLPEQVVADYLHEVDITEQAVELAEGARTITVEQAVQG